jgi:hypothetical protein
MTKVLSDVGVVGSGEGFANRSHMVFLFEKNTWVFSIVLLLGRGERKNSEQWLN